jgi:hypothetical protein
MPPAMAISLISRDRLATIAPPIAQDWMQAAWRIDGWNLFLFGGGNRATQKKTAAPNLGSVPLSLTL